MSVWFTVAVCTARTTAAAWILITHLMCVLCLMFLNCACSLNQNVCFILSVKWSTINRSMAVRCTLQLKAVSFLDKSFFYVILTSFFLYPFFLQIEATNVDFHYTTVNRLRELKFLHISLFSFSQRYVNWFGDDLNKCFLDVKCRIKWNGPLRRDQPTATHVKLTMAYN